MYQHVPSSESTALLEFLEAHSFTTEAGSLYRVQGRFALKEGDFGQALSCYAQSGNSARLYTVVLSLLDSNPTLEQLNSILQSVDTTTLSSFDCYCFLVGYRDFLHCSSTNAYEKAGDCLVSLFSSGSVPQPFLSKLLGMALGLLEGPVISIGVSGSFELMRILNDIDTFGKQGVDIKVNESLELTRMALVRNLARAIAVNKV